MDEVTPSEIASAELPEAPADWFSAEEVAEMAQTLSRPDRFEQE